MMYSLPLLINGNSLYKQSKRLWFRLPHPRLTFTVAKFYRKPIHALCMMVMFPWRFTETNRTVFKTAYLNALTKKKRKGIVSTYKTHSNVCMKMFLALDMALEITQHFNFSIDADCSFIFKDGHYRNPGETLELADVLSPYIPLCK